MTKKLLLFSIAVLSAAMLRAQTSQNPVNTCGTEAPPQEWEEWFQVQVKKYVENMQREKRIVNHTIPVIVHVIHFGEAYGTYPNVDSNQIKSQIPVLNNDFSGNGFGKDSLPSYFQGLMANTGISFCLAHKDPQDNLLTEKGIHRVSAAANSWQSPATPTLDLKAYFYSTIIPATYWDPTKYLNIWISDKPPGYPLNSFGTYPAATGLTGLYGGMFGNATNDGIWVYTKAFGTIGVVNPTNRGRTATHEIGHWLGLRHIWGDGNCLSDYAGDTPWQKAPHYGCVRSTPPNQCGVNSAPNGEMPMNFMDMTDDDCKYMFTNDQNVRMQVAMSQCPFRNLLGTHGKCTNLPATAPSSAIASFNTNSVQCLNQPFYPMNTSSGSPNPTFLWTSSPAANFNPNSTVPVPGITFANAGTYTLSLVTSNSVSSSTYSMVINAFGNCQAMSPCIDTLKIIKNTDTLNTYRLPNNPNVGGCQTGFAGYLTGTNCYKDKEMAQYFSPSTYSGTPLPQVNSVIVLFDSIGTKAQNAGTQITCKIYGGTANGGPVGLIDSKNDSLGKIVSRPKVLSIGYVGKPNQTPITNSKIIPFKFDFNIPVVINSISGFFAAIQGPVNSSLDSINVFSNTRYNTAVDSSAWFLQFNNSWKTFKNQRGMKVQLAILPQITCSSAAGIKDMGNDLSSSVNIMPNPGTGVFNVIFTLAKEQEVDLRIIDMMGKEIVHSKLGNVMYNAIDVDLTAQPNGVYFAEISGENGRAVKKIVLSK